jgi:hypothetical protein
MGTHGDAISYGSSNDRIDWLIDSQIKPWLLWIWNEQAFFFESTDYTLDHSIEQGSQL